MITIRTRTSDGTWTTQTQLEVRKCKILNICFLISWSLLGGFVNNNPGFGWNLGAPAAAPQMPQMPMPQPPPPSRKNERYQHSSDSGDSGVDELFTAKDAGAESFAHYIVKWVSCLFLCLQTSHDSLMCSRSLLLRKLSSTLCPHKHKHNCVKGVQRSPKRLLHTTDADFSQALHASLSVSLSRFLHEKRKISSLFLIDFLPK